MTTIIDSEVSEMLTYGIGEEDKFYDNGYQDGCSDTLYDLRNVMFKCESLEELKTEIYKQSGYKVCPDCSGSGENKNPDERDIVKALLMTMGARVSNSPLTCKVCHGERYVA